VLLFTAETHCLKPNECFVVSGVGLEQIAGGRNWQRFCSTFELMRALRNPSTEYGPDIRVAVHARLVQPLLDMTLLFLGLPLVLARESRTIFMAIGMCLGIVSAFFLVVMTCHALGNNCLIAPATAAWTPLAIFVPVAVALAEPLRD
jgi:lipopolysaccharide export system permease protein